MSCGGGHLGFRIGKKKHKLCRGPSKEYSHIVTVPLVIWFLRRRSLKFQPIRTHYWPWQPCWISDQHEKHKLCRGPPKEHSCKVCFQSVQWFQRRRLKCEKLTPPTTTTDDGRQVMAIAHLTLRVRWANNKKNLHLANYFLAHLTRWVMWAIAITWRPSSSVRRPASIVIRH